MEVRHCRQRRSACVRGSDGGGRRCGIDKSVVNTDVRAIIAASRGGGGRVGHVLLRQLTQ